MPGCVHTFIHTCIQEHLSGVRILIKGPTVKILLGLFHPRTSTSNLHRYRSKPTSMEGTRGFSEAPKGPSWTCHKAVPWEGKVSACCSRVVSLGPLEGCTGSQRYLQQWLPLVGWGPVGKKTETNTEQWSLGIGVPAHNGGNEATCYPGMVDVSPAGPKTLDLGH